jgi:hypothetical protein
MAELDQMNSPYQEELMGLNRQRALAQALLQRGMQTPQGQMVDGRYVKSSPLQYLGNLAQTASAIQMGNAADTEQAALAQKLRQQEGADLSKFYQLQYGGNQVPGEAQAGPMPDGGNIPLQTITAEANPQAAFEFASKSQSPAVRAQLAEMLKPQKFAEGEIMQRYNPVKGKMEITGKGNEKYRAPLHFDVGNAIELRDPLNPTKVLQRIPKGISPESAARLADEGIGGYGGGISRTAIPTMPTINQGSPILAKPTTQATTTGENIFADYNNSITPPAGLSPKDQRKYMAESNTPLTGDASTRVQGGLDTIDAIDSYRKILTDYSKLSSLNPTQRANLEAAYYTMTLKSKEANKLGVLNGQDQAILEKLSPNPNDIKSLLVTNDVLSQQALKQRNLITGFTVNSYGEQRKKIPDYVINKIQPLKTEITPAQASKIERPSMIDETTWGFMTPQEKSLFKR